MSESATDFKQGLDSLLQYCSANGIEINISKTKIQVFHCGHLPHHEFSLNGREIEIVNNFSYLGFTFSVQLSFSEHARIVNAKARSKCGLLFTRHPLQQLPLNIVLELFDVFVLPVYSYGLPLWLTNCANSSLLSINATLTKFLKRYLQIPSFSNNAIVHFITSTIPLSEKLKNLAPNIIGSLSFPSSLHGHKLSFLSGSSPATRRPPWEDIPSAFWLSRTFYALPVSQKARRRLCRELFDLDHFQLCQTNTFHPSPSPNCLCANCGNHAHMYHARFCN